MARSDCPASASDMAVLSSGSILKASAIHCAAISMDSPSSGLRVPSVVEFLRKSTMARASFLFDSVAYQPSVCSYYHQKKAIEFCTYHVVFLRKRSKLGDGRIC